MSQFRGQLSHTVRFCFFNAEEVGLIGSNVYASVLKEKGSSINSVICTDMIGYNSDNNKIFEIHAGHNDSHIRDISLPIAKQIATWAHSLGSLAPAQIYKGTQSDPPLSANDSNRDVYDGAIGRSDHFSFQQQGYPACVVSEDFFTNLGSEPSQDPNPNYHSRERYSHRYFLCSRYHISDFVSSQGISNVELIACLLTACPTYKSHFCTKTCDSMTVFTYHQNPQSLKLACPSKPEYIINLLYTEDVTF